MCEPQLPGKESGPRLPKYSGNKIHSSSLLLFLFPRVQIHSSLETLFLVLSQSCFPLMSSTWWVKKLGCHVSLCVPQLPEQGVSSPRGAE